MDEQRESLLESIWWIFFGTVVTLLIWPGIVIDWLSDKSGENNNHKSLGFLILFSIIGWLIIVGIGLAFLLPW